MHYLSITQPFAPEHLARERLSTLEHVRRVPRFETELHEEFVRPAPSAVARMTVLAADLAELAGPERQEHRAAVVTERGIKRVLRSIEARPDIPAPGKLILGHAIHSEGPHRRLARRNPGGSRPAPSGR